ncbi:AAA family ATPase [Saccharomonospora sp. NPDC046836]|uniref:AAA family ATPase n=1 Tax=Saccharomonospora sp. NPDC046836 TaxID=3156921 RepID=UPI0034009B77
MSDVSVSRARWRSQNSRKSVRLSVSGYKAIRGEVELDIAPLTLISGTNSSGKSSFMQPFLMLKQTVEAQFDPGALLIHGPNVQLTSWLQGLNRGKSRTDISNTLGIKIRIGDASVRNVYTYSSTSGLNLEESEYHNGGIAVKIGSNISSGNLSNRFPEEFLEEQRRRWAAYDSETAEGNFRLIAFRNNCFLDASPERRSVLGLVGQLGLGPREYARFLREIIHVPGLRGNPERTYNSSVAGLSYPGTMESYVASVIHKWGSSDGSGKQKLAALSDDLRHLGLTWKVKAQRIDDVRLELLVGRMPSAQAGGANDLVSIADVGFGVSQTLPILVALHAARTNQIVYIEQPETHLHPKAQTRLGEVLVAAAKRGVRVVVETHSSLLLRAVQTSIAKGEISPDHVSLNWFSRDSETGFTKVDKAEIDSVGRFGGWPVDFDEVADEADWAFLSAVQEATSNEAE